MLYECILLLTEEDTAMNKAQSSKGSNFFEQASGRAVIPIQAV
jgi:hypothetical protein